MLFLLACVPTQIHITEAPADSSEVVSPDSGQATDTSVEDVSPDTTVEADTGVESVPGSSETDSSAVLFSDDEIPIFYVEISAENTSALIESPYEYVEVSLTYNDITYGPVGMRTKGENSWRPFDEKSSLKFDFNRYDDGPNRILGLKGLTFNAMNEDYSMMHERVAYRMYREAGVPAARANHAVIYVNDELYGLFTVLDTIDDVFLARWFEDSTGSMFEQHDGDFTDDYVQDNIYFQLEEGKDDRTGLQAVADALEDSGQDAIDAAGEYLSWDSFLRYWAVGGVVQNFDAYPFRFAGDDCHIYHDPTTNQLHYIPHGVDESFYYHYNIESQAGGHLSAKCREVTSCRDDWAGHVSEVLDVLEKIDLATYAEAVAVQIEGWAQADPQRNYDWSYVEYYQADMISNIRSRRTDISADIGLD